MTAHGDHPLDIALSVDKRGTHWENTTVPWSEVVRWTNGPPKHTDKKTAGRHLFGLLEPTPDLDHTDTGCPTPCERIHRNRDAVVSRSAIALDADGDVPSDMPDRVKSLGLEAIVYATASSTLEALRLRIVVPLLAPVAPEEYGPIADLLMHDLSREGDPEHLWDRSCRQASRIMFNPAIPDPANWSAWHVEGALLDGAAAALDAAVLLGVGSAPVSEVEVDLSDPPTEQQREKAEAVLAKAVRYAEDLRNPDGHGDGVDAPGRNEWCKNWLTPLLGFVKGGCLDYDDTIERVWEAIGDASFDRDEFDVVCRSVWNYARPTRPTVVSVEDVFADEDDETASVDRAKADPLYEPWDVGGDAHLAKRVALGLAGTKRPIAAWGKNGWARWDGKRWDLHLSPDRVRRLVRDALLSIRKVEIDEASRILKKAVEKAVDRDAEDAAHNAFQVRLGVLKRLKSASVIEMCCKLMRADLAVKLESFDGPDLNDWFNCANGTIDLRTGELHPHDPKRRFTKVSPVAYVPGATHPDWTATLSALPPESAEWMQLRLGQAMSGWPPADDVVPFCYGGGENAKTTFLNAVSAAFGDFFVVVPENVLLSNGGNEHPAIWMVFKGARLAVLEELPEERWLDSTKLKNLDGTEDMKGRFMGENWVQWKATHALIVSTNYDTKVSQVDWGTWRRLARVTFPFTFVSEPIAADERKADPGLRARMRAGKDGQHEAVLAYLVGGAVRSYEKPLAREDMPERIAEDSAAWRARGNPVVRFAETHLAYDPGSAVLSSQVYAAYRAHAHATGQKPLGDQTFWSRAVELPLMKEIGVEKKLCRIGELDLDAPGAVIDRNRSLRLVTGLRFTEDGRSAALGLMDVGL